MTKFFITVRSIAGNQFVDGLGSIRYLAVPEGQTPTPAHAIGLRAWMAQVMATFPRDASNRITGNALFFVHGYNLGITDVDVEHSSVRDGLAGKCPCTVISFDWPSWEDTFAYRRWTRRNADPRGVSEFRWPRCGAGRRRTARGRCGSLFDAPVAVAHSRAVLSLEAVTTCVPSGEKIALKTRFSWPLRTAIDAPVAASHSRAVLSLEAVTTCVPSGEKTALKTPSSWPLRTAMDSPVAASHSRAVLSIEVVTTRVPSGETPALDRPAPSDRRQTSTSTRERSPRPR